MLSRDSTGNRAARLGRTSTPPSALSRSSASRTGMTLVPKTSASERVGNVSPGEKRPSRIACLSVR